MITGIASVAVTTASQITDGIITPAKLDSGVMVWNFILGA